MVPEMFERMTVLDRVQKFDQLYGIRMGLHLGSRVQ